MDELTILSRECKQLYKTDSKGNVRIECIKNKSDEAKRILKETNRD